MNTPSLYTAISEQQTRHFLVGFVSADSPDGENAVELWAKNWSRRRLKVLAKHFARQRGFNYPVATFVPRASALNWRVFPWGEASLFQVVPSAGGVW